MVLTGTFETVLLIDYIGLYDVLHRVMVEENGDSGQGTVSRGTKRASREHRYVWINQSLADAFSYLFVYRICV